MTEDPPPEAVAAAKALIVTHHPQEDRTVTDQQPPDPHDVIAPGAFADLVGRRLPVRIGSDGPLIGHAEVTGPDGQVRVTIDPLQADPDVDLGPSLVYSARQVALALGLTSAQPSVVASPGPGLRVVPDGPRLPVPGCPGRVYLKLGPKLDEPAGTCSLALGHHGGCR